MSRNIVRVVHLTIQMWMQYTLGRIVHKPMYSFYCDAREYEISILQSTCIYEKREIRLGDTLLSWMYET